MVLVLYCNCFIPKEKDTATKIVTKVTRNTVPTFRNLMRTKCKPLLTPIIPEGLN